MFAFLIKATKKKAEKKRKEKKNKQVVSLHPHIIPRQKSWSLG